MIQDADLLKLVESAATNNGDALRLAISLGIIIRPPCQYSQYALAEFTINDDGEYEMLKVDVSSRDWELATRLAICMAAKKIMATRDE